MKAQLLITISLTFMVLCSTVHGQHLLKGEILDAHSLIPIKNVQLRIDGENTHYLTNNRGQFTLNCTASSLTLIVSHPYYIQRIFPISIDRTFLDLGILVLYPSRDIFVESEENIPITNSDLLSTFLHKYATGMPFRLRGLDHKEWTIDQLNMNSLMDGKIHQESLSGVYSLLKTTPEPLLNKSLRRTPSTFDFNNSRKGLLVKGGVSNHSFAGKLEVRLNLHTTKTGWNSSLYFSRRWAKEGYLDGSLYDSWSFGGLIQRQFNLKNTFSAAAIYAPLRRGGHAPLTERVYNQMGATYNPLWGMQLSLQRNSYISKSRMPLFFVSYSFHPNRWKIKGSLMVQFGERSKSKLAYQDANNPFPDYWANQEQLTSAPQINWESLYRINQNQTNTVHQGAAKYMVYEDVSYEKSILANLEFQHKLGKRFSWTSSLFAKSTEDNNYARPIDLLGSSYYYDVNEFKLINGFPAQNEVGNTQKQLGDKIKYNFQRHAYRIHFQHEVTYVSKVLQAKLNARFTHTSMYRNGIFKNQAYANNSFGKSEVVRFNPFSLSSRLTFQISPQQRGTLGASLNQVAPTFEHSFVNPREQNRVLPILPIEKRMDVEASYSFTSEKLAVQLAGYWIRHTDGTHIESFFADGGIGSNYFTVVTSQLDLRNVGIEWSFLYQISAQLQLHLALALGQYSYGSNAQISVDYNTVALENNAIDPTPFTPIGEAYLKNYRQGDGPQQLYGMALQYAPKFFELHLSANFYNAQYLNLSALRRTSSFFLNPLTNGQPYEEIDTSLARNLLKQVQLPPFVLLNAAISKWWQTKNFGVGISAKLNNLLNKKYKTNGYEQHRLASYKTLSEDVSLGAKQNFGPKYRFGMGRNFSVQLTVKF